MRRSTIIGAGAVSFTAALVAACGGGQAPIYSLQPTDAPLRYSIEAVGSQTVETPNGPAGGGFDTNAVILLSLGDAASGGRAFSARFESFDATLESQMGTTKVDGSSVVGPDFRGIVSSGGEIRMTGTPEVAAGVYDENSIVAMFPDILAPLPPGGVDQVESWPHAYALPSGGGLDGETSYTGTARFAGDTTWNGVAASVIVSKGTVHAEGRGTPQGAPGEVELSADGNASAVYVWDSKTGVLLAMRAESESTGVVTTMGLDLPLVLKSMREARLEK